MHSRGTDRSSSLQSSSSLQVPIQERIGLEERALVGVFVGEQLAGGGVRGEDDILGAREEGLAVF